MSAASILAKLVTAPVLALVAFLTDGLLVALEVQWNRPRSFSYVPLFIIAIAAVARALLVGAVTCVPLAFVYRRAAGFVAVLVVLPIAIEEHPWTLFLDRHPLAVALQLFELLVLGLITVAAALRAQKWLESINMGDLHD